LGRSPDPQIKPQLLRAVSSYLLEHGLAGLSLRPLAAAIGTSPRMLLYHFGSKEQLLTDALVELRVWQRDTVTAWSDAADDANLAAVLADGWSWLTAPQTRPFLRLFFEVYALALQDASAFPGFLDRAVADWMSLLEPSLRRVGLSPARARNEATLLIAAYRGLLLDLLATGDDTRVTYAHRELINRLTTRLEEHS
jgi:AcrR family transcriptional regulator